MRQARLWAAFLAGLLALSFSGLAADPEPAAAPAAAEAKPEGEAKPAEDKAPEPAAKEAKTPAELTPGQMFEGGEKKFENWVEVSAGGMFVDGDKGMAEQRQQMNKGASGGIQDLHYKQAIDKTTTLTLDGHSIFGPDDYAISLDVRRENLGYAKFGFENFTTFYDSSGGYFEPDNLHFSLSDEAWELERGAFFFEAGLDKPNIPKLVFKYTHRYREGEKDSTVWAPVQTTHGLRGLYPAWYDVDEKADLFELDGSYKYKATTFGLGVRYETGELDNSFRATFRPAEPAITRNLTDTQGTSYDMVSVHAWTETWIKKNVSLSTGFLFANLDNEFSGSRIYGDDFDVNYSANALNSLGYFDLNGGSHKQEYMFNLNLMTVPLKNVTVVPSLRVQKEDWDAESTGIGTLGDSQTEPFSANSDRGFLDVRERIDIRYNGITNWVFFGAPEWAQGSGNLAEHGGLSQIDGTGVAPVDRYTDDSSFCQKYLAGVRWYPSALATFDAGGYYKLANWDWDHTYDGTPNDSASPDRYPAFLTTQDIQTYDANFRVTLRPMKRVTLVTRYEFQESKLTTAPDSASGLAESDTSDITSHVFGQNASWTPWSRLTLQLGFNYVVSETETPTSDYTEAVLDARNNYWTINFNAGLVLDNKTDLNLGYFYYNSDNYEGIPQVSLPLGASSEEHGITASIVRRISQNVRLNLKYGFSHFEDNASGGYDSYDAHLVYSSLQYRF
jgi:hypothetical protein